MQNKEITFKIEEAEEGGYWARALGHSIFTQADDLGKMHDMIREAVRCHFDEDEMPQAICILTVLHEVIPV